MRKVVLVGLDPGERSNEVLPPGRPSGARIASLAGLDERGYLSTFDRLNMHRRPSPAAEDRSAGGRLGSVVRGRRVVALGRRVSVAVGTVGWFEWDISPRGFVVAAMPHPSGLSQWWNYQGNRDRASSFLRTAILPCIHVEGPDGSGKTTLIRSLSAEMGLETIPTDDPPSSWAECIRRISIRVRPGIICDRSSGLISELVYGPVLRSKTIAPESEMWNIVKSIVGSISFVYCRPPRSMLDPKRRTGESLDHTRLVERRLGAIADRYDEVMQRVEDLGGEVIVYDRTNMETGDVARCAELLQR